MTNRTCSAQITFKMANKVLSFIILTRNLKVEKKILKLSQVINHKPILIDSLLEQKKENRKTSKKKK